MSDQSSGVEAGFKDVSFFAAQCKFRNCRHSIADKKFCAVQRAARDGDLHPLRLQVSLSRYWYFLSLIVNSTTTTYTVIREAHGGARDGVIRNSRKTKFLFFVRILFLVCFTRVIAFVKICLLFKTHFCKYVRHCVKRLIQNE